MEKFGNKYRAGGAPRFGICAIDRRTRMMTDGRIRRHIIAKNVHTRRFSCGIPTRRETSTNCKKVINSFFRYFHLDVKCDYRASDQGIFVLSEKKQRPSETN
jgi:hypothetical protein